MTSNVGSGSPVIGPGGGGGNELPRYTVGEGAEVGTTIVVLGDPNDINLLFDTRQYTIESGNPDGLFEIESRTGALRVASILDDPQVGFYLLTVTYNDPVTGFETLSVELVVSNVNDAPDIVDGQNFAVAEGAPAGTVVGTVLASDPDDTQFDYSIVDGNDAGLFTIDVATGALSLAAAVDDAEVGQYLLTVEVSDGEAIGSQSVIVDVTAVNDAPNASDDFYQTDGGEVVTGNVLNNDSDVDSSSLTVSLVSDVREGTLLLNEDGSFIYQPLPFTYGPVSFVYALSDGQVTTEATATIDVQGIVVTTHEDVVDPDDGETSLREAIALVVDGTVAGAITFDPTVFAGGRTIEMDGGGAYTLAEDIIIDGDVDGDDKADVTLDALRESRAFVVRNGAEVVIESLSITNAQIRGGAGGAAIRVHEDASLSATFMSITDSRLASGAGGTAIRVDGGGSLDMTDSFIGGNTTIPATANNGPGLIHVTGTSSQANLTNVTIANNEAWSHLVVAREGAQLTVQNATIIDNEVYKQGFFGFVVGTEGTDSRLEIYDSIVAGNDFVGRGIGDDFRQIGGDWTPTVTSQNNVTDRSLVVDVANYGGPVQTAAINTEFANNPLIDGARRGNAPQTDARGVAAQDDPNIDDGNSANGGRDIGAYELRDPVPSLVVTTASDIVAIDDFTSLREAIGWLQDGTLTGTITFDAAFFGAAAIITLDAGEIDIVGAVAIDGDMNGDGIGDVTIDANSLSRIFDVEAGTLVLDNLTLTGGNASFDTEQGVKTNDGGAIRVLTDAELVVRNSILTGNQAADDGGAIGVNAGTAVIVDTVISDNSADDRGGGVYGSNATLDLQRTTLVGNASSNGGGGIATVAAEGTATLRDVTIARNTTDGNGGGVSVNNADLTATNVTVANNTAGDDGGGISLGGEGTHLLQHVTITGNEAGDLGGSLLAAADTTLSNSIIVGNTDSFPGADSLPVTDIRFTFDYEGVNLIGIGADTDGSDGIIRAQSVGAVFKDIDPATGGGLLADNGGPVETVALAEDRLNRAIDRAVSPETTVDARGVTETSHPERQNGGDNPGGRDLGAYEARVDPISLVVTSTADTVDFFDGATTLREAIFYINEGLASGTITFDPTVFAGGATVTLAGAELNITASMTIDGDVDGDDRADVTVDANGQSRVFDVDDGTVVFDALVVAGGQTDTGQNGGGLRVNSGADTVTIRNSTFRDNEAFQGDARGGAVYVDRTPLAVVDSAFINNSAADIGGAIAIRDGDVTVENATFVENVADDAGAAIHIFVGGTLDLNHVTITANVADADEGAINVGSGTQATIANSIVLGNHNPSDTTAITVDTSGNGSVRYQGLNIVGVGDDTDGSDAVINAPSIGAVLASTSAVDTGGKVATVELYDVVANPAVDGARGTVTASDAAGRAAFDYAQPPNGSGNPDGRDIGASELVAPLEDAGLVVTTALDVIDSTDGLTSLREALSFVNNGFLSGTITFDANVFAGGQAILLDDTLGELEIRKSVAIDGDVNGDNVADVTLDADAPRNISTGDLIDDRILRIHDDVEVTLDALAFTRGAAGVSGTDGGAIIALNNVDLTIQNSILTDNFANDEGGAVAIKSGSLTIRDSELSDNWAIREGGAIHGGNASVTISGTLIEDNLASTDGGGVWLGNQRAIISDVTFNNNRASDDGGGLWISSTKDNRITESIFTGNSAADEGGGVFISDRSNTVQGGNYSRLTVSDSEFEGNSARLGGGISSDEGRLTVVRSRIDDNEARDGGGGVYIRALNLIEARFTDTLVSGNTTAMRGGGFLVERGDITGGSVGLNAFSLNRVTVSGNSAGERGGGISFNTNAHTALIENTTVADNFAGFGGGGIDALNVGLNIRNATITNNYSQSLNDGSGGLFIHGSGGITSIGRVKLENSIVVGNVAAPSISPGEIVYRDIGLAASANSFQFQNNNIVGVLTGDFSAPAGTVIAPSTGDVFAELTPLRLGGVLADNGGPVPTVALKLDTDNPALDASSGSNVPGSDARGVDAIDVQGVNNGGTRDLGAYELEAFIVRDDSATALSAAPLVVPITIDVTANDTIIHDEWILALLDEEGVSTTNFEMEFGTLSVDQRDIDDFTDDVIEFVPNESFTAPFSFEYIITPLFPDAEPVAGTVTVSVAEPSLVVDTTADGIDYLDGVTTLREAISYVEAGALTGPIVFDASMFAGGEIITLTEGAFVISGNVTIDGDVDGDGRADVTIDANEASRVFEVSGGTLNLQSVTASNGSSTGSGGVILVEGGGDLNLDKVTVFGGQADGSGGGIAVLGEDSAMSATDSMIIGSFAYGLSGGGGGIYAEDGVVALTNTTVAVNAASNIGGGILLDTAPGGDTSSATLRLDQVTITANGSYNGGGGVYANTSGDRYKNSIILGNYGDLANDLAGEGEVTLSDDIAGFQFLSSMVGLNIIGEGDETDATDGRINARVEDVFDVVVEGAPGGRPADNGGPVQTVALKASFLNPAIDAAGGGSVATTDARGIAAVDQPTIGRPDGDASGRDLGAYETTALVEYPVAATDDVAATTAPASVTIDVLSNDVARGGAVLTVTDASAPNGAVVINPDGTLTYTPDAGFAGVDTIDYVVTGTVTDIGSAADAAEVTVTVTEAPSLIVTTTADVLDDLDGVTSLREAIGFAEAGLIAGPITFDAGVFGGGGTVTLDGSALAIGGTVTIDGDVDGDGRADVTIDANGQSRVMNVTGNADVTLDALTLTGGLADGDASGGGIRIFGADTDVAIRNSSIVGNQATDDGGGIFLHSGTLTLDASLVSGNSATGTGGGIRVTAGEADIRNVFVVGNTADGNAGAIFFAADTASVDIINTTVTGNTTNGDVGGVAVGNNVTGAVAIDSIFLGNSGRDIEINGVRLSGVNIVGLGSDTDVSDGKISAPTLESVFAAIDGITGGGELADNGGPVETVALAAIDLNPALDGASSTAPDARGVEPVDQPLVPDSGTPRDLGAFELGTVIKAAPVANDDAFTTDEDGRLSRDVLANDSDRDSADLAVTLVSDVQNGTLDLNEDGTFTYDPDPNVSGSDSFTYEVSDGERTDTATVVITINPVNDRPVAANDVTTTPEDTAITVAVLANDTDVDDQVLTVVAASAPNGAVTINADGTLTYTPNVDFNGADTISYTVEDAAGEASSAEVAVTVLAVNDAPVAADDGFQTDEDQAVSGNVIDNDSDAEGSLGPVTLDRDVRNGSLTLNPDGSFTYAPDADFNGTDSFIYRVTDGALSATAIATVTVASVNDAPVAVGDAFAVIAGMPAFGSVLSNDSDIDGPALTATLDAGPTNGNLTLNSDGSFLYTPAADFVGTDTFVYTASDGDLTDTATVTLTVEQDSDADLILVGDDSPNTLTGRSGNDIIIGNGDDDILDGASGNDLITGGAGNDTILPGSGNDTVSAGPGDDTIVLGDLLDLGKDLDGGADHDTITTLGADLRVAEFDTTNGNVSRIETLVIGDGTGAINGTEAGNLIDLSGIADVALSAVNGGEGNDTLVANDQGNTLNGEDGDDALLGGTGADELDGGLGNDRLDGGAGNDTFTGGDGDDTFVFGLGIGKDVVTDFNQAGNDILEISGLGIVTEALFNQYTATPGVGDFLDDGDVIALGDGLELSVTQVGSDLVVAFGTDEVTLQDVTRLSFDDFAFV